MNLIIDSGATKALWAIARHGEMVQKIYTRGLHPLLMPNETMHTLALEAREQCSENITRIFFYGTGCKLDSAKERVKSILQAVFPQAAMVEVNTDMLGAARALCQREPGIACILGTGSNTCFFDGVKIIDNKGGHGFILGDEGSGAALGKQLMIDFLNDAIPANIRAALMNEHQVSDEKIIESVYRQPMPSRFLATYAPFLLKYSDIDYVKNLIDNQLDTFLKKYVLVYPEAKEITVNFAGSIAWHFRPFLEINLKKYGLRGKVYLREPMEGLIKYHE